MRIVQFRLKHGNPGSPSRVGVQLENQEGDIVDLVELGNCQTTIDLIKGGDAVLEDVKRVCQSGRFKIRLDDVELLSPVTSPDKLICIGMNYKDHCEEQNVPPPEEPLVFSKFSSCIAGPFQDIPYPEVTEELDWEVELAMVIGKGGKNITKEKAMDHIFGYTVAHDVSARDWQLRKNGGQWLLGKTMDAFCPLGPALVTKDEIEDPGNLRVKCMVNGKTKQDSNTQQLIFKPDDIVAWLSRFFTLHPGDVILTGTPPGVGVFMTPPQFLERGDVVECLIEKIGYIRNTVV